MELAQINPPTQCFETSDFAMGFKHVGSEIESLSWSRFKEKTSQ